MSKPNTCWADFLYLLAFMGNFFKGVTYSVYYLIREMILFWVPKRLRAKDVSKDIVLITGGASGLGRLFALKFAKLGSTVVIWDLNLAGLEETTKLVEELRARKERAGKCYHYQVDISHRANVYAAAERVKQEIGVVTIVVNNAGIVTGRRFMELDDEKIIKTFEVNALAHFWIIKAFLPGMMARNHGHLVYTSSIAGLVGSYQLTDYCASKFASVGLEESLRLELNCDGYDGIHSTIICPYYIKTGLFAGIGRSLIPIKTPEFVVDEAMKAILINQEILCVPWIVYLVVVYKYLVPAKSFMWSHRAMGATNTMKSFKGRSGPPPSPPESAASTAASEVPSSPASEAGKPQQPQSVININQVALGGASEKGCPSIVGQLTAGQIRSNGKEAEPLLGGGGGGGEKAEMGIIMDDKRQQQLQ